jgi:hypothetical protein
VNRGTMRQHPFLMRIAALVVGVVLLIFTVGTQVSYANAGSSSAGGIQGGGGDGEIQPNGSSIAGGLAGGGDGGDAR